MEKSGSGRGKRCGSGGEEKKTTSDVVERTRRKKGAGKNSARTHGGHLLFMLLACENLF